MDDEVKKLNGLIETALDRVYLYDKHLIVNRPLTNEGKDKIHHVGERAIVFRFALYLQDLINHDETLKEYNLDCEYNRNGRSTKNLPSFPNGTYPDVILHKRGNNNGNILVMEFKTYWNDHQDDDIRKIIQFTDWGGEYRFHYGVTVLIARKREDVIIKGYKDGKCIFPEKAILSSRGNI